MDRKIAFLTEENSFLAPLQELKSGNDQRRQEKTSGEEQDTPKLKKGNVERAGKREHHITEHQITHLNGGTSYVNCTTPHISHTMTTEVISSSQVNDFDYVIVGGGTAGCVIASRLSEYLPHKKVLVIEAGPSDFNDDRVLKLKDWLSLLGGDLDYDYGTTEQPQGTY